MARVLFAFGLGLVVTAAAARDDTPTEYERWLTEEVVHVIAAEERAAFLTLDDDRLRTAFVDQFWAVRDPTPGTARNERRDEHYQRIEDADRLFGNRRRAGWKTERGKLWIQLGAPLDRTRYVGERRLHPIEHWIYRAPPGADLPPIFHVIFFKENGGGDYTLYDPVLDGPEELVGGWLHSDEVTLSGKRGRSRSGPIKSSRAARRSTQDSNSAINLSAKERRTALIELGRVSSMLQRASLSPIPGDPVDFTSGRAMPLGAKLVAQLDDFQDRQPLDVSYAGRMVRGEGHVDVEWSLQQLGMVGHLWGSWEPSGATVLHLGVEIPATSLTLVEYGGRVSGALEVIGRVFQPDGTPVLQIDEVVELELSRAELARLEQRPFLYRQVFPLIPGEYRVDLVVRDRVTREFGIIDGRVEVPVPSGSSPGSILLAREVRPTDDAGPFVVSERRLIPAFAGRVRPGATIHAVVPVWLDGSESAEIAWRLVAAGSDRAARSGVERARRVGESPVAHLIVAIDLKGLSAGGYVLVMERPEGERRVRLDIAADAVATSPWMRTHHPRSPGKDALERGEQWLQSGDTARAITWLEQAAASDEAGPSARLLLAENLLRMHDYRQAASAVEPLTDAAGATFERAWYANLLLGLALSGRDDAGGAIQAYRQALALAPENTTVLNVLAEEHVRAGEPTFAVSALQRSLAIDQEQPQIRDLLVSIEHSARPSE